MLWLPEKRLRHSFLVFLKSCLRRNITSVTRRTASKAEQGLQPPQGSSLVSSQHINPGTWVSGWNDLPWELLKPVCFNKPLVASSQPQYQRRTKEFGPRDEFSEVPRQMKMQIDIPEVFSQQRRIEFKNPTNCLSSSASKPMLRAFKSTALSQPESRIYCPLLVFLIFFIYLQKQRSLNHCLNLPLNIQVLEEATLKFQLVSAHCQAMLIKMTANS